MARLPQHTISLQSECHDSVKCTRPVNTSIRFPSHNAQPMLKVSYRQFSLVSHTYFRSQMNQSMHQNVADDSRTKQNFSRHNFSTHAQLLRPNKKNPLFRVTLLTFKIRVGRSASLFFLFIFFLAFLGPKVTFFVGI